MKRATRRAGHLTPEDLRSFARSCGEVGRGRLQERADIMEFLISVGRPELASDIAKAKHLRER